MEVLSSIEIEYFEGHEDYIRKCKDHLDYLVMGEHYNFADGQIVDTYSNCNYSNVIAYAKVVAKGLDTKLFRTIAHPDIFAMRNFSGDEKWPEIYQKAGEIILEAAKEKGTIIKRVI